MSRTPVRLGFEQLVREGYLEQLPRRGFRVRSLTPRDFSEAIDVRGVLEGMAARLVAERGATATEYALLVALIGLIIVAGISALGMSLDDWYRELGGAAQVIFDSVWN